MLKKTLNRFKRAGVLALALSAGLVLLQPTMANAADWHADRDGHHDRNDRRGFVDRGYRGDWGHDRDRHDRRDWDHYRHDRDYLYFNYTPAPNYYYAPAPSYSYPYSAYPNDPYYYSSPYNAYPNYPY